MSTNEKESSMTETEPATSNLIPIYSRGTWTTGPHPVEYADGDYDDLKSAAGFEQFTSIGESDTGSLTFTIWRHYPSFTDGRPGFLLEIDTPIGGDTVGAGDIADVMDLVARWAPAAQAAAVSDLLTDAVFDMTFGVETNAFAAIGALMAEGAERRGQWAQRQREQAAKRRAEARAKKASKEAEGK